MKEILCKLTWMIVLANQKRHENEKEKDKREMKRKSWVGCRLAMFVLQSQNDLSY